MSGLNTWWGSCQQFLPPHVVSDWSFLESPAVGIVEHAHHPILSHHRLVAFLEKLLFVFTFILRKVMVKLRPHSTPSHSGHETITPADVQRITLLILHTLSPSRERKIVIALSSFAIPNLNSLIYLGELLQNEWFIIEVSIA